MDSDKALDVHAHFLPMPYLEALPQDVRADVFVEVESRAEELGRTFDLAVRCGPLPLGDRDRRASNSPPREGSRVPRAIPTWRDGERPAPLRIPPPRKISVSGPDAGAFGTNPATACLPWT
jgi:hypothetical protein